MWGEGEMASCYVRRWASGPHLYRLLYAGTIRDNPSLSCNMNTVNIIAQSFLDEIKLKSFHYIQKYMPG